MDEVYRVTHLYLLWLDNGDFDMPVDPAIRSHYTDLARKHPACPIDEEAMAWLKMSLRSMTEDEIRQAIGNAVAMRRWPAGWQEAHNENLNDLLAYRRTLGVTRPRDEGSISFTFTNKDGD
jgi:hypothetical protein